MFFTTMAILVTVAVFSALSSLAVRLGERLASDHQLGLKAAALIQRINDEFGSLPPDVQDVVDEAIADVQDTNESELPKQKPKQPDNDLIDSPQD